MTITKLNYRCTHCNVWSQVAELLQAGHAVQPGGAARGAGAPLGAQGRRALAVGLAAGGGEDLALYPHLLTSTLYHVKVANTLNYDAWHIREALNRWEKY